MPRRSVRECTRRDEPLRARPDDTVQDAAKRMAEACCGSILVCDGEKLAGIFTERDFLNRVVGDAREADVPVRDVMTSDPTTIRDNASVQAAIEMMEDKGFRHLPVIGVDGRPVGVMSVKGIMHYLVEYFPAKVYNLPPTTEHTQPAREGA